MLCEYYPKKLVKMGIQDTFGKSGNAKELLKYFKLTDDDIINRLKKDII